VQNKLLQAFGISLAALLLVGCGSPTPLVVVPTTVPKPTATLVVVPTTIPKPTATLVVVPTTIPKPTATLVVVPTTIPKPTAIVTSQKGDKFQVSNLRYVDENYLPNVVLFGLPLVNGLTVDFQNMKSFEIVKVEPPLVTVEITILDGRTMTEQVYLSGMVLTGNTDIGVLRLGISQVKRVEFQR
jgi:hypothetical protein